MEFEQTFGDLMNLDVFTVLLFIALVSALAHAYLWPKSGYIERAWLEGRDADTKDPPQDGCGQRAWPNCHSHTRAWSARSPRSCNPQGAKGGLRIKGPTCLVNLSHIYSSTYAVSLSHEQHWRFNDKRPKVTRMYIDRSPGALACQDAVT